MPAAARGHLLRQTPLGCTTTMWHECYGISYSWYNTGSLVQLLGCFLVELIFDHIKVGRMQHPNLYHQLS